MTTTPNTAPAIDATSHNQGVLNDMVNLAHRLARLVVEQAEAGLTPAVKAATAFDNLGRCIRRCIWLERELAKPAKTTDRVAARKRIIRDVEDAIQRQAEDRESRHEELRDRLDSPDLEDEIGNRPVADIIADIIRDLGLAHIPGTHPWKRRTPAAIAELCAHAARTPAMLAGDQTAGSSASSSNSSPHIRSSA